jgi:hypothetical protein
LDTSSACSGGIPKPIKFTVLGINPRKKGGLLPPLNLIS